RRREGDASPHACRRAADFRRVVFLAGRLADRRAIERVVFLPAGVLRPDVFLRARRAVDLSPRGLILRSAIAVSLASVAFSSLRVSANSLALCRWPSPVAHAIKAP